MTALMKKVIVPFMMVLFLGISGVNAQQHPMYNKAGTERSYVFHTNGSATHLLVNKENIIFQEGIEIGRDCSFLYEKDGNWYSYKTDNTVAQYYPAENGGAVGHWEAKIHWLYPGNLYSQAAARSAGMEPQHSSQMKEGEGQFNSMFNFSMGIIEGNFVIYKDTEQIWSTNIAGVSAADECVLKMQDDGDLVLYDKNGKRLWASETTGIGAVMVQLENSGGLVMYKDGGVVVWNNHGYKIK
ncbi:MAG: hypothetical protein ACKVTZ_06680 [Bacteroidia bacterium]